MEIKVGFEIGYAAVQPTPMVIMLSIHPSRHQDIVGVETIVAEPDAPIGFYRDSFGNVCGRLVAPAGHSGPIRPPASPGSVAASADGAWVVPKMGHDSGLSGQGVGVARRKDARRPDPRAPMATRPPRSSPC